MLPSATSAGVARFGPYEVDVRSGEARKFGIRIKLGEQPLRILILLMERRGELVTREELRTYLWSDDSSSDFDHSLNSAVQRLRDKLSDRAERAQWIETVPRRGYRFVGIVDWTKSPSAGSEGLVPEAAPARIEAEPKPETSTPLPLTGTQGLPWRWRTLLQVGGIAALLCLVAFVSLRRWSDAGQRPAASSGRVMLAVLPFEDLSADSDEDHLSDDLTEETINQLGEVNPDHIGVIARTTSMVYKHTSKSIRQIGNELNVDYILESSVRRDAERLRVTAQLIRTRDQVHLWANSYDRRIGASATLQEEVAKAVAQQIAIELSPPNTGVVSKLGLAQ